MPGLKDLGLDSRNALRCRCARAFGRVEGSLSSPGPGISCRATFSRPFGTPRWLTGRSQENAVLKRGLEVNGKSPPFAPSTSFDRSGQAAEGERVEQPQMRSSKGKKRRRISAEFGFLAERGSELEPDACLTGRKDMAGLQPRWSRRKWESRVSGVILESM